MRKNEHREETGHGLDLFGENKDDGPDEVPARTEVCTVRR